MENFNCFAVGLLSNNLKLTSTGRNKQYKGKECYRHSKFSPPFIYLTPQHLPGSQAVLSFFSSKDKTSLEFIDPKRQQLKPNRSWNFWLPKNAPKFSENGEKELSPGN